MKKTNKEKKKSVIVIEKVDPTRLRRVAGSLALGDTAGGEPGNNNCCCSADAKAM